MVIESRMPTSPKKMTMELAITISGITSGRSTSRETNPLPRNSQRESASAAGVPMSTETTVVRNATHSDRCSAPRRTLSFQSTSYQCRLACSHTTT